MQHLVDFFVHLCWDKLLTILAVKEYQSSFNHDFALKGMDLCTSRELSILMKSFEMFCPEQGIRPTAWDVPQYSKAL